MRRAAESPRRMVSRFRGVITHRARVSPVPRTIGTKRHRGGGRFRAVATLEAVAALRIAGTLFGPAGPDVQGS